jgi:hypothetical protein
MNEESPQWRASTIGRVSVLGQAMAIAPAEPALLQQRTPNQVSSLPDESTDDAEPLTSACRRSQVGRISMTKWHGGSMPWRDYVSRAGGR